ncbi:MAG: hypothetical protein E3J26_05985 [Candidatus Zixiibacteriota bacterium]|nr:MAG: hypothetical protein E3J26_05985 [candidate division Zixibacteria bacterium]
MTTVTEAAAPTSACWIGKGGNHLAEDAAIKVRRSVFFQSTSIK